MLDDCWQKICRRVWQSPSCSESQFWQTNSQDFSRPVLWIVLVIFICSKYQPSSSVTPSCYIPNNNKVNISCDALNDPRLIIFNRQCMVGNNEQTLRIRAKQTKSDEINAYNTNKTNTKTHVLNSTLRRKFLKLDSTSSSDETFCTAWYSRLLKVVYFSFVKNLLFF